MAIYQAALMGEYANQNIVNLLYYRTSIPEVALEALFAGEQALAEQIYEKVWKTPGVWTEFGADLKASLPIGYKLVSIIVRGYQDDTVYVSSDGYTLPVGEFATQAGETNGPDTYCVLRANLAPFMGPGIGLPTKGYLAVGPLRDAEVGSDGKMVSGPLVQYTAIGVRLKTTLISGVLGWDFVPVRVRFNRTPAIPPLVGSVLISIGYRDVIGFLPQPIVKHRKSRQVEA